MDNIFSHFKNHQNHQNFLGGGKLSVRGEVYGERLCPKSCVDAHFCAVLCSCCSMRKPCANPIFIYLFVGDQAPTPPHLLSDYLAGGQATPEMLRADFYKMVGRKAAQRCFHSVSLCHEE